MASYWRTAPGYFLTTFFYLLFPLFSASPCLRVRQCISFLMNLRTLAIDLGDRRIGLALSDEGGHFATPVDVLQITDTAQAIDPIIALIKKESVHRLVLGLPLNMDGTIGPRAKLTVAWAKTLTEKTGIPVIYIDERLSSFAADQVLSDRKRAGEKLTHQKKKSQRDALAAAIILQSFLDGQLSPISLPDPS